MCVVHDIIPTLAVQGDEATMQELLMYGREILAQVVDENRRR